MEENQFSRLELLLGEKNVERLHHARVAVFGIGGVGGYVCEALVRSGIGAFDLVDNDKICESNLNRQIIALHSTIGRYKTEVMKERMLDINPEVDVRIFNCFFLPETAEQFCFEDYDYVVDAVDTVTAKIEIIMRCQEKGIPVISAMGAGNKIEAGKMRVADLYETKGCPLARVMRRELKKRGVQKLKVVYSEEEPIRPEEGICLEEADRLKAANFHLFEEQKGKEPSRPSLRKQVPGSTAFVPSTCGLLIAGEIVKDLTSWSKQKFTTNRH